MNASQEQTGLPLALTRCLRRHWGLALITLAAAALMFLGLAEHAFWADEAITAIYSRNTLTYGLPCAFDGRNLCAYGTGTSLSPGLLATAYPWLQFYVAAASFGLFGANTFAGRLPFALIGVLCVPLTYWLARRFRQDRVSSLTAALLLAACPQYLLFMRQCRYFGLTVLFSVLMLLAYPGVEPKKKWPLIGFVVAGVLLFYSHFLMMIAFYLSLAICFCMFHWDWRRFRAFGAATAIVLAATLPWLLVLPRHGGGPEPVGGALANSAKLFWWHLRDLNRACFLPVAVLPILALAVRDRRRAEQKRDRPELFLLGLILCYLVILCLLSPQPLWRRVAGEGAAAVQAFTKDADIRYAVNLMPMMAILMGAGVAAVWRRSRVAGALLAAALMLTNLATLTRPRCYLWEYVREFARGYQTSTEAAIRALRSEAKQDDLVLVLPEYQRDPLMFYLGDKLRFCGILPPDEKRILPVQRHRLPRHVYSGEVAPRFIVSFRSQEKRGLPEPIRQHIVTHRVPYQTAALNVHWRDLSRPELIWRTFRPRKPKDPADRVFIYRQKPSPPASPRPRRPSDR